MQVRQERLPQLVLDVAPAGEHGHPGQEARDHRPHADGENEDRALRRRFSEAGGDGVHRVPDQVVALRHRDLLGEEHHPTDDVEDEVAPELRPEPDRRRPLGAQHVEPGDQRAGGCPGSGGHPPPRAVRIRFTISAKPAPCSPSLTQVGPTVIRAR